MVVHYLPINQSTLSLYLTDLVACDPIGEQRKREKNINTDR